MHEVVHIWIGKNSLYNATEIDNIEGGDEVRCNAVAAEIMVPSSVFKEKIEHYNNLSATDIEDLARYFRCSSFVIIRKLLNSKKISKKDYAEYTEHFTKKI